ncbi:MAG: JAB domain-containing protein [Firmicutes bacterium]|nr:JAB domain-containing protein [Bacillota bacterium]
MAAVKTADYFQTPRITRPRNVVIRDVASAVYFVRRLCEKDDCEQFCVVCLNSAGKVMEAAVFFAKEKWFTASRLRRKAAEIACRNNATQAIIAHYFSSGTPKLYEGHKNLILYLSITLMFMRMILIDCIILTSEKHYSMLMGKDFEPVFKALSKVLRADFIRAMLKFRPNLANGIYPDCLWFDFRDLRDDGYF